MCKTCIQLILYHISMIILRGEYFINITHLTSGFIIDAWYAQLSCNSQLRNCNCGNAPYVRAEETDIPAVEAVKIAIKMLHKHTVKHTVIISNHAMLSNRGHRILDVIIHRILDVIILLFCSASYLIIYIYSLLILHSLYRL